MGSLENLVRNLPRPDGEDRASLRRSYTRAKLDRLGNDRQMVRILSYGCNSSAGDGVEKFWKGLETGKDHLRPVLTSSWPVPALAPMKACLWPENQISHTSVKELLVNKLISAWQESLEKFSPTGRTGVILASTKGCIEDFIWSQKPALDNGMDTLTPVLDEFLVRTNQRVDLKICISNACASSMVGTWMAEAWLRQKRVDHVLLLACDQIGPFILNGFHTLHAISAQRARPFSKDRDGLQLGEAAAAIWFSNDASNDAPALAGIATVSDGSPVTRPSPSGETLKNVVLKIPELQRGDTPNLVIAHGTGTVMNDAAEDDAFCGIFGNRVSQVAVTGTKGSIGHTLGASAAMDLIAACEVLRRQQVFRICNTEVIDPKFRARYLHASAPIALPFPAENILVTSLGFGGVHAAALVQRAQ